MEPHTSHPTFTFSFCFFSVMFMAFHSAQAVCVPRNSTYSAASPIPKPESSPGSGTVSTYSNAFPIPESSQGPVEVPPSVLPPPPASNPPPQNSFLSASELQSKPAFAGLPALLNRFPKPNPTHPILEKICKSTDYPADCEEAIAPQLGDKTDLLSVVELAIKAAIEHTKLAISTAGIVAATPGTPPKMMSILSDIKDSYSDALDNFQQAMDALPARDVGTMNSMLSAAITDFSDCDDNLFGFVSPLLDFNAKLTKMTSNCLAIVALIDSGSSPHY
ncbi:hypothetical protein U1Q18_029936 [Sarracenia purpurea var. burkii]